ncbi:hypothetical protein IQ07DRAFT_206774 [Pyrenochaeta sp. DS3sAY3a]|nr:hypothetical protein IQ07DRAFT_206774 [Pyrenochaeta sp. DS3sAY3a]
MLSLLGTHSVLVVDEGLIDCIAEMQHLTRMINTEEGVAFPELYIRSFTSARIVVEYKLFRLCNESVSRFSRAMCIAAQIYANRVLRTFERGNLFIHHLAERLKKAIEQTLDDIAEGAQMNKEQLMSVLWMSVMGAVGSRNGPLRAWFVGMVRSGCYNAGVSTSSAFESVLGSMLWSERSLGKDRIALWKEVEQGEACDPWSLW